MFASSQRVQNILLLARVWCGNLDDIHIWIIQKPRVVVTRDLESPMRCETGGFVLRAGRNGLPFCTRNMRKRFGHRTRDVPCGENSPIRVVHVLGMADI